MGVWHWRHRRKLPGFRAALPKPGDRHQSLINRHLNKFVFHPPSEHPADALDVLVDHPAGDVRLDHGVAGRFELQWAEITGRSVAVELAEKSQCRTDAGLFIDGLALLDVVGLGVRPESEDELVDGEIGVLAVPVGSGSGLCGRLTGPPLSDAAFVLLVALRAAVLAQIVVASMRTTAQPEALWRQ